MPEGWEVPTLSFLKDEPLIFGVPRQQAGFVILIGGGLGLFIGRFLGILFVPIILAVIIGGALRILRFLYKRDPHWAERLTSGDYPLVRYLGN